MCCQSLNANDLPCVVPTVSTMVGTGSDGYTADGGLANSTQLSLPSWVTFDSKGSLFFVDGNNYIVRKLSPSTGFVYTVAGTAGTSGNSALLLSDSVSGTDYFVQASQGFGHCFKREAG